MNKINATSDKTVHVRLTMANVLNHPIRGSWEKEGPAIWDIHDNGKILLTLDPAMNGFEANIRSLLVNEKVVAVIGYTAKVRINMVPDGEFFELSGETEITFMPATMPAQLIAEEVKA